MALLKSDQLRAIIAAHGFKPYTVKLEFASEQPASFFTTFSQLQWTERPAKPQSMGAGYGADMFPFSFTTWDPQSVEADHLLAPQIALRIPQNGDFVVATLIDQTTAAGGRTIFRGQVRSVHEQVQDGGVVYQCEAVSDVSRLNDYNVTFTANFLNNPINPTPHFDPAGNVYYNRLKTVFEIAQEIMTFRDAWNSTEYFQFTDIDWNGLDTDPRCGAYIPTEIQYQDTPKGVALQTLLSAAGNFTFLFVPQRGGRGKIRVVELNLACNRCGDLWNINWAPITEAAQQLLQNYAFNFAVAEDSTEWNTKETANVVRVTSQPIRFYSGNWMIPEVLDGDNSANCIAVDNDSVTAQQKRCVSNDLCNFRFTAPLDNAQDHRKLKRYPVGLPLFPDWNIHEDFLPAFFEIQDVQIPASGMLTNGQGTQMTPAQYRGLVEFQTFTVGDEIARGGAVRLKHINNLRVYQAYYVKQACPACTPTNWPAGAPGPGLVDRVYSGANNEPTLTWEAVKPDGTRRTIQPTDILTTGERIIFTVNNYIMDPKDFGTGKPPPAGLIPWSGLGTPSAYPLPWKNLCPYCRGTGMKPEYKLRMVEPMLYAGRNNQISQPNGVSEIPLDPDFTQTGAESWEQTQNRLSMHQGPLIQLETQLFKTQLPIFQHRNEPFSQLKTLSADNQTNQFPNPLQFTALTKRIPLMMGVAPTSSSAQIVPPTWTCVVPYSTIQMGTQDGRIDLEMGRVIFDNPVCILCIKPFTDYIQLQPGQYLITNGILTPRTVGRGQMFADRNFNPTGFWRQARVWMTFHYTRPLYYEYLINDDQGKPIPNTVFQAMTPEGLIASYEARAAIHDGRFVIEMRKLNPQANEAGGGLFNTGNRVLQRAISDNNAWIETSVSDLYKMPLPTIVNADPATLEAYKKQLNLDFVRGRLMRYEQTTPGEIQAEMEGYISTDYATSTMRPKLFSFRLRDDRSRMMQRGLRELELANNVLIQGSLTLVGVSQSMNHGLGYINKPNRGKAAVKRIVYTFSEGLVAELEVNREEARVGETIPTDADLMNDIQKTVLSQSRIVDYLRAHAQAQVSQAPLPNQVNEIGGAKPLYRGS